MKLYKYLKSKLNIQQKNTNLVEPKISENGSITIESGRISDSFQVGNKPFEPNSGEPFQNSQPEQNGNFGGRFTMDGNDAGNGLADKIWEHLVGNGERGGRSDDNSQQNDDEKNERAEHSVGGIVSGRNVSDRTGRELNSTNNVELDSLISKYKGQKLTNEQVGEVVSATCFVSDNQKILLKENLNVTNDLKEICNQFQSGGTAKEGRGILDEYYTDSKIVDAVRNLIKDHFKTQKEISVLEPSVGTGNFLYATKDLAIRANSTAFEINETTAKIAKILHPEADINLRSFETEFIDEKGNK